MPDYRNRPPVDAPRPTLSSVLRSAGAGAIGAAVAAYVGIAVLGYAVAVVLGLAWR